jgi:carboxymethylenebutenolidase
VNKVSRRTVLGGIALVVTARARSAEVPQRLELASREGPVVLARYATNRTGKRPAVILLHGSRGFEPRLPAYERYAGALTDAGIDAYFLHYYTGADVRAFETLGTRSRREAYEDARYAAWGARVSSALDAIMARSDSSGRVGLLGFSLGGFVAAAAAARDERISALAVLYGGMPEQLASHVKRMPPVIELHGDADRNVPFASGEALVKLAKAVGAPAEQVRYPGKAHGFDFANRDVAAEDALQRVSRFFQARLSAA